MFSHVTLGTADVARAKTFYEPVLATLGIGLRFFEPDKGWAGFQPPGGGRPLFVVMTPFDGGPASSGNGAMVAFEAATRAMVDAFHATAISAGATDEGEPALRPHYHPNYYGAYLRDPDGNKLCCACHAAG